MSVSAVSLRSWIRRFNAGSENNGVRLVPAAGTYRLGEPGRRPHRMIWTQVVDTNPESPYLPFYLLCSCLLQQDAGEWQLPTDGGYGEDCPYIQGVCQMQLRQLTELRKSRDVRFIFAVGGREASNRALIFKVLWEIGDGKFVGHPVGGRTSVSDLTTILGGTPDGQGVTALLQPLEEKGFITPSPDDSVIFCDLVMSLRG